LREIPLLLQPAEGIGIFFLIRRFLGVRLFFFFCGENQLKSGGRGANRMVWLVMERSSFLH